MSCKPSDQYVAACPRRALCIALAIALCAAGCVHRRFTVRSNPPGARVFVDEYEIGTTPVSHDFVYYGTRKIRLVKDGYETLTILQPIPTPWWDLPGIDFVSENLVPTEIRDHRVLDYQMQPQVIVPTEQLLTRADELRRVRNPNIPVSATGPAGVPPQGTYPENTLPPPSLPPSGAPGTAPPGTMPPGTIPPGAYPPGALPPNTLPPGTPGTTIPALPPGGSAAPGPPGQPPSYLPPGYQPRSFQQPNGPAQNSAPASN
ncbi:MAG TPA: PEGA domain-containing protein [Pirellulales bacterium]|nr:PEGA domain-containing protein [Pirellulales bacterium]